MRRFLPALTAMAAVMLAAAAAYLIAFGAERLRPGPPRAQARSYAWLRTVPLTGVVIREEVSLAPARHRTRIVVGSGQRISAGQAVAVTYDDGGEYMRAALLLRLRRELAALETAPSVTEDDALLRRRCSELGAALVRGDFDDLNGRSLRLELGLFPAGDRRQAAESLRAELRTLEAAGAEEGLLTAASAGFFSPGADGWEALSPRMFRELTCEGLEAVLRSPALPSSAPGRLVTGSTWLLAVLTDGVTGSAFAPGETVSLTFDGGEVTAEVILLRAEGDGRAAVVFRCREALEAVLSVRTLAVEAVTDRASGLLIPREALHREDDSYYVYRWSGPFLHREPVALIRLLPEGALVSSPGLRDGSPVLPGEPEGMENMVF